MPRSRIGEGGKQQTGQPKLKKGGFRGEVRRAGCRMEEGVKSIGKLHGKRLDGADTHINRQGAGEIQVHRAAVQEKEQYERREQYPVQVHGKNCME